jgi:hypothetical protein
MKHPTSRVAHLHRRQHVNLSDVIEAAVPQLSTLCRNATLFLLISAFWGVVVYLALMAAL